MGPGIVKEKPRDDLQAYCQQMITGDTAFLLVDLQQSYCRPCIEGLSGLSGCAVLWIKPLRVSEVGYFDLADVGKEGRCQAVTPSFFKLLRGAAELGTLPSTVFFFIVVASQFHCY